MACEEQDFGSPETIKLHPDLLVHGSAGPPGIGISVDRAEPASLQQQHTEYPACGEMPHAFVDVADASVHWSIVSAA
jgi:hypothetical protein